MNPNCTAHSNAISRSVHENTHSLPPNRSSAAVFTQRTADLNPSRARWRKRSSKQAFHVISDDPRGLSSHSLRKSWAMPLYEASGHDPTHCARWTRPSLRRCAPGLPPDGTRPRRISHPQDRLDPAHESGPRSRCMSGRNSRPTAYSYEGANSPFSGVKGELGPSMSSGHRPLPKGRDFWKRLRWPSVQLCLGSQVVLLRRQEVFKIKSVAWPFLVRNVALRIVRTRIKKTSTKEHLVCDIARGRRATCPGFLCQILRSRPAGARYFRSPPITSSPSDHFMRR